MEIKRCAFCGKNEGTEIQIDSETLQEFFICVECDYALNSKKVIDSYKELTIQELRNLDIIIDNQIEDIRLKREGEF